MKTLQTLITFALISVCTTAAYADGTWTAAGNSTWGNTGSWANGTVPGTTTVTGDTETAIFNSTPVATGTITLDTPRNLQYITFDTSAGSYQIGLTSSTNALSLTSSGTITIASTITSTGKTETFAAPIVLEGNYTFANEDTVTGANADTFKFAGPITSGAASGTTTLSLNTAAATSNTITGPISDGTSSAIAVTLTGPGSWTLGGANTYSGGTTVNSGKLIVGGTLGTGGVNLVASTTNLTFNRTDVFTVNNIITGSGSVTKSGTGGVMSLTSANSYTGLTSVTAGVLNISNASALGTTAAGTTVATGATLQLQGNINVGAEALTLSGAGAGAVSGGITATGALENVSGTNTYGGLITLSGTAAPTTISSDSGSLSLINTGTITGAGVSLNLAGAGNGSIASVIGTTTGGLSMTGTGTWTLSGNSTYSGGTTVSSGKLYVNNGPSGSGTGTGAVTIGSGAMLAGNGVITPSGGAGVVIQSGGTLSSGAVQVSDATHNTVTPGASGTNGLVFNNAEASSSTLTIAGGANLTFSLGAGTTAGSGALTFNAPNTNSTFFTLTGGTTDQIFGAGAADTINLVDLTAFTPVSLPSQKLQLALQNPYLLIVTTPTGGNANADFANLITSGGEGVNGYVLGVDNGSGVATPFILNMTDNNGNQLSSAGLQLYLYNGELEVIPEPSTWAMLLGGVAMLLFTVRRRARMNS